MMLSLADYTEEMIIQLAMCDNPVIAQALIILFINEKIMTKELFDTVVTCPNLLKFSEALHILNKHHIMTTKNILKISKLVEKRDKM